MNNYFLGNSKERLIGNTPTYFYGIRRTDEGDLYFVKINQMSTDIVEINKPADVNDDYTEFTFGEDFYEGRDVYHNLVYDNLKYEQFKWDDRDLFYYINDEGEMVIRTGIINIDSISESSIEPIIPLP